MGEKVLVNYSGGIDSTLSAARLASEDYDVYLVTYNTGAMIRPEISKIPASMLKERFPENIMSHDVVPLYGLFKKMALKNIEEDFKKYNVNLICMGCKLAMLTESIRTTNKKEIGKIADGYSTRQSEWPEQMPEVVKVIGEICEKYGIEHMTPVYEITTKADTKMALLEFGLLPKSIEGACQFGGTFSLPKVEIVLDYIHDKEPLIEKYLKEHLDR